jgi:hypothetical protein
MQELIPCSVWNGGQTEQSEQIHQALRFAGAGLGFPLLHGGA